MVTEFVTHVIDAVTEKVCDGALPCEVHCDVVVSGVESVGCIFEVSSVVCALLGGRVDSWSEASEWWSVVPVVLRSFVALTSCGSVLVGCYRC